MGIRVVVAEDSLLVRERLRRLLDHQPDIEVVGVCADLPELCSDDAAQHASGGTGVFGAGEGVAGEEE